MSEQNIKDESIFLSENDLRLLTGFKHIKNQMNYLIERKIPFIIAERNNHLLVSKKFIEEKIYYSSESEGENSEEENNEKIN